MRRAGRAVETRGATGGTRRLGSSDTPSDFCGEHPGPPEGAPAGSGPGLAEELHLLGRQRGSFAARRWCPLTMRDPLQLGDALAAEKQAPRLRENL